MTTSNHVHELANQANALTMDELNLVSGGNPKAAPKQDGFPTETIKMTYGAIEWTYTQQ